MRLLALALALLVPLAAAQAPVALVTLVPEGALPLIEPLKGAVEVPLVLTASCILAETTSTIPATLLVKEAPAWTTVVIDPATMQLPAAGCEAGWTEARALVQVSASDRAPAYSTEPILIEAIVGTGAREHRAIATINATALYFAVVDLQLREAIAVIAPGELHEFRVGVVNHGNGLMRASPALISWDPGMEITMSPPIVLESTQQGGTRTSGEVGFFVRAPRSDRFVNYVSLIEAKVDHEHAGEPKFAGDMVPLSLLVTVRSGAGDHDTPVGALAPLAFLVAALIAARSWGAARRR